MPVLKPDLRTALQRSMGGDMDAFEQALTAPPPVSIRINPRKPSGLFGEAVPWCAQGRYLAERPVFTLDPRLHAGAYYVQEASSMILEPVFNATGLAGKDIVALDLCAAPGGKSTHLRSLMSDASLLVCNEVEAKRAVVLQENLWKWGHPEVVVCNSSPEKFTALRQEFDLILVDAPCSGEGLMRKDPFAVEQWTAALVRECAVRQQRILDAVWPALRPGGFLIYSTCTYEACENEEQVERVMAVHDAEHVVINGVERCGVIRGNHGIGLRCLPHLVKGEGQFMALLRKPSPLPLSQGEGSELEPRGRGQMNKMERIQRTPNAIDDGLRSLLVSADALDFRQRRDVLFAASKGHRAVIDRLVQAVDPLAPGIPIAHMNGTQWKPHAALALGSSLNRTGVAQLQLEREDALRFLRGEVIRAADASGTVLVTFEDLALGWAKGAGNRWNNHWPDRWRIRMR